MCVNILTFANNLMNFQEKPEQWSKIDMIPLPKSGDLSEPTNYRGVSLSSVVAKCINKLILNRIQPKLEVHLRPNQNGFRPGRSTTAHILALRRLIEGVRSHCKNPLLYILTLKKHLIQSIEKK